MYETLLCKRGRSFLKINFSKQSSKPFFFFPGPSQEDLWKIREAISQATTLEEVERLNRMLQAGQIPGQKENEEPSKYIFLFWLFLSAWRKKRISKNLNLGLSPFFFSKTVPFLR